MDWSLMKLDGIVKLLQEELVEWFEAAIKGLPNLVVALLVFFFFLMIAKLVRQFIQKVSDRITDNSAVNKLLESTCYLSIVAFGLFTALGILKLDKTVTSLLAGAGVLGLALGFAFQEITANFISGIFIAFRKPFSVGDIIEAQDVMGTVDRINLRSTVIRTFQGQDVFIPNKYLLLEKIKNYSLTGKRLVELEVGVTYSADLKNVIEVTKKALEGHDIAYPEETMIFFREFGDSSINFLVRYWIKYPGQMEYFKSTHDAIIRIKAAFDKNNISIPFPIRTLDVNYDAIKKVFMGNTQSVQLDDSSKT